MYEGLQAVSAIGGAEASLNGSILVAERLSYAVETEISSFGYDDAAQEAMMSIQHLH